MKVSSTEVITEAADMLQNQDYSGALKLLQSIRISELVGEVLVRYCIHHTQAAIYTGDYDTSYIDFAIESLRVEGNPDLMARAKMLKGFAMDRQGRFDDSVQHYLEASILYRHEGNPEYAGVCLNLLGLTHTRLGNYSTAAHNFGESLELMRSLREASGEERLREKERGIAHNLAYLNIQFGRLNEGVNGYLSYPLSRQELASSTAVNFHINVAQAYALLRRTDAARDALESCKAHIEGTVREEALYWYGLGLISYNDSDIEEALKCFEKVQTLIKGDDSDFFAGLYRWKAECRLALSQYREAAKSAQKAFDHAFRSREQIEIGCCHRIFGSIAAHEARHEIARNHFMEAITVLERIDSQYELARTRQIAACSGLFPVEQCRDLMNLSNSYYDAERIPRLSDRHTEEILINIAMLQSSPSQRKRIAEIMETQDSA